MSPKRLAGTHAEDVGGVIVEPGQTIPKGADPETVRRLEAEGRISDDSPKKGADASEKED